MVRRSSLFMLMASTILSTFPKSPCVADAAISNSFSLFGVNSIPPRAHHKEVNKKKFKSNPTTKSTSLVASESAVNNLKGGSAVVSNEVENKVPSFVFHSIFLVPLLLAWAKVSQNLPFELFLCAAQFSVFAFCKLLDAIVDDGLNLFKGDNVACTLFLLVALPYVCLMDDFILSFSAGISLDSLIGGKLDCWEFQTSGLVAGLVYLYKLYVGTCPPVVDMLLIAIFGAVEEFFHDMYDKKKKSGKDSFQIVEFFHDSRMFSMVTLVPIFLMKGYSTCVAVLIGQEYGYEIGSYVTEKMLIKQNEKK